VSVRLPFVGHEQAVIVVVDVNQELGISMLRELTGEVYHLGEVREYPPQNVIEIAHVTALEKMPEIKRIIKIKKLKNINFLVPEIHHNVGQDVVMLVLQAET
jgi:hypothetical protein